MPSLWWGVRPSIYCCKRVELGRAVLFNLCFIRNTNIQVQFLRCLWKSNSLEKKKKNQYILHLPIEPQTIIFIILHLFTIFFSFSKQKRSSEPLLSQVKVLSLKFGNTKYSHDTDITRTEWAWWESNLLWALLLNLNLSLTLLSHNSRCHSFTIDFRLIISLIKI